MTYNQKRHIELLKRSQDLRNQKKIFLSRIKKINHLESLGKVNLFFSLFQKSFQKFGT